MVLNPSRYDESELVFRVIGCAMKVLNELGHGIREKAYERALCVEFRYQGIRFASQQGYPVIYRGEPMDDFIPDLQIQDRLLVEVKTAEKAEDSASFQVTASVV